MMNKTIIFLFAFCATLLGQEQFENKNASKIYDARIEVERCADDVCEGKLKVELIKKSAAKLFQVINLDATQFDRSETELINGKQRYEYQSVIFFEDYNFDGIDDLAIRDGNNSGYGGPSYQVYLFSKRAEKFVRNPSLTDLAQNGLGMFEVDKKRRILRVSSKSGCCWHQTQEYSVVGNRAKKIFEQTEDAMTYENKVEITTKRLVNGRWRTKVRYEKK
jgi:hypothetical protein